MPTKLFKFGEYSHYPIFRITTDDDQGFKFEGFAYNGLLNFRNYYTYEGLAVFLYQDVVTPYHHEKVMDWVNKIYKKGN